jgi:hypothetical protein
MRTLPRRLPVAVAFCLLAGCMAHDLHESRPSDYVAGDIEAMLRFPPEGPGPCKTYLVMTSAGGIEECRALVLRNVTAALGFGAVGEETLIFLVRPTRNAEVGYASGFSPEQLVELLRMPEAEAAAAAAEHAWVLAEVPDTDDVSQAWDAAYPPSPKP